MMGAMRASLIFLLATAAAAQAVAIHKL